MDGSQEELLSNTLSYVVNSIPYYKQINSLQHTPLNITNFPIIDGSIVTNSLHEFYNLSDVPDFAVTTGGTTSDRSKVFFLNYSEMDSAFCDQVGLRFRQTPEDRLDPDDFDGIALLLTDNQHGFVLPPGHGKPVIALPLEVGRQFELVARFLKEGLVINERRLQFTQLFGSITKLRALTEYCVSKSYSPNEFSVVRIVSFAFYTSQFWREYLTSYWDADVIDAYGLTEFIGAVTARCKHCRGFHFPPTVYVEYLNNDYSEPVTQGIGNLVLTTLLPHRVSMPLVRYATGDIIEILERCPKLETKGFDLRGRRGTVFCTDGDPNRVIISPFDVIDCLESTDEELGRVLAYDEQVKTAMSWGVEEPVPEFSNSGYPQMNCRVDKGIFRVLIEIDDKAPTVMHQFAETVKSKLKSIMFSRNITGFEDKLEVSAVLRGGIKKAGLSVTLA